METSLTDPSVGKRVWTIHALHDHGPSEGPKINVPSNTGGTITATSKPYMTMDMLLFEVRWDTGQRSKHYRGDLICIGAFQTLAEFEKAVAEKGKTANLLLGPQGGFREFSMEIGNDVEKLTVRINQDQRKLWHDLMEPLVRKLKIEVVERRLPSSRRKRK